MHKVTPHYRQLCPGNLRENLDFLLSPTVTATRVQGMPCANVSPDAPHPSNYRTIALISHASKVMLKILQARLQQYVNCELPDVQAGLEKAEEPEIKLSTLVGSSKKQESSRKTSISALLTMPKPLTVWIITHCGKLLKRGNTRPSSLSPEEACMEVKKQQLELFQD